MTALVELLKKPFVYSVVEPGALPVFLMLLPLLGLRRNEPVYPGIRAAGFGALLMVLAWGFATYAPWRFLFPAVGMLCLLTSTATTGWSRTPIVRRAARAGASFCVVWGILFQVISVGTDLHMPGRYPAVVTPASFLSGRVSREGFVEPVADAVFWMNENLPADAVVLYAGEARTYYADHRFMANTVYDHSHLRSLIEGTQDSSGIAERARAAGITHVYVHSSELRRLRDNYGYLRDVDMGRFREALDLHGRLIWGRQDRRAVYELVGKGDEEP
jgi:hypothetical protein